MRELKSMVEQTKIEYERYNHHLITAEEFAKITINWARFYSQPLEIWMFVPTDEEGNVLEVPDKKLEYYWNRGHRDVSSMVEKQLYNTKCKQYQKAKERVLFEGVENLELLLSLIDDYKYQNWMTVEWLAQNNDEWGYPTLTQTALTKIYG